MASFPTLVVTAVNREYSLDLKAMQAISAIIADSKIGLSSKKVALVVSIVNLLFVTEQQSASNRFAYYNYFSYLTSYVLVFQFNVLVFSSLPLNCFKY